MRQCSFCGRATQDDQTVCPSCIRELSQQSGPPTVPPTESNTSGDLRLLGFLALVLAFFGIVWIEMSPSDHDGAPRTSPTPSASDFAHLGADVGFTGTQFIIRNTDDANWTDISCELNGGLLTSGYVLHIDSIRAGDQAVVGAMEFTKSDGTRFNPFQTKPLEIKIVAKIAGNNRRGYYYGALK